MPRLSTGGRPILAGEMMTRTVQATATRAMSLPSSPRNASVLATAVAAWPRVPIAVGVALAGLVQAAPGTRVDPCLRVGRSLPKSQQ